MSSSFDYLTVAHGVRRGYSAFAHTYASSTGSFERYPGLREEVLNFFGATSPGPVLDIGCGSGRDGTLGANNGCYVVMADSAVGMLQTETVRRHNSVVCCDAVQLPFGESVFSGVMASGVLLHIPKEYCPKALGEILRVVRPGGLASISMKKGSGEGWRSTSDFPERRWFSYYDPAEFAEECRAIGFIARKVWSSGRHPWFTVTASKTRNRPVL